MTANLENLDSLINRVADCRRTVEETIRIDQQTHALHQALEENMSSDQAAAYATLIRAYISDVPKKLAKLYPWF